MKDKNVSPSATRNAGTNLVTLSAGTTGLAHVEDDACTHDIQKLPYVAIIFVDELVCSQGACKQRTFVVTGLGQTREYSQMYI